ncbi:MAG: nucleoside-diphosphate kinase, partial [Patescibacteria group bacterium]
MERTLVVLKPDAILRSLSGEILSRFEKAGLKLIGAKMVSVSQELADKHYPADREELWTGIGDKTLDHYKELEADANKLLGTDDPKKIGEMVRVWLLEYISSGPVLAMVFEGPHAVELIRKICGHTLPLKSPPGTIRGDFSFDSSYLANTAKRAIKNLIHASGSIEEAEYEIPLWFEESELVKYKRVDE